MKREFSTGGYQNLLGALRQQGYQPRFFHDAAAGQRHAILRHDIDLCVKRAADMAAREADLGWTSTYFILLSTQFYNSASRENRLRLAQIRKAGHEIGLHFDASLYDQDLASLDMAAQQECALLESLIEAPVRCISFHRPAKALQGLAARLAGRIHAYEPRFFNDMGYVTDSGGQWSYGHPLDHPALAQGGTLQLVTHPVWWAADTPSSNLETLAAFRAERHGDLHRAMAANLKPYAAAFGADT